ncbi:MAG TPA: AsmA family protein, partial [Gammaproteobacteria bacterium]|nr:AsmA family protein [Gammaproteobacteria bacterium]
PKAKTSNADKLAVFALNGVKIINAQFNWDDKQQKQKVNVSDVNLSLGAIRTETKIPFNLHFVLKEKSVNAKVNFKSEILFSSNLKQFSFYNTDFSSNVKLASLKEALSPQINSALMQLDLEKQTFNTQKLSLSERSLKLETQLSAKQISTKPYIKSQLNLIAVNPRTLAKNFEVKLPAMADKKALTQLSARLNIKGTLDNLFFSNLKLKLDDTTMSGKANIKAATQTSSVSLAVDTINLDRYLPTPTSKKQTPKTEKNKTQSQNADAVLIPVALLNSVNLNADFKVKKLQIKNTRWTDLTLVSRSKNGHIKIKPLSMQGYEAKVQSDFDIKTVNNNALLSGNLNIQKIKAGKILNDLIGKDKLKGTTTITASFNTRGIKLLQLKQNLNGKLKLRLRDGTLKGFDIDHQKKVLDAKIKRQPIPAAPVPAETKIANLSASAIIKKGILTNKDLRAATPLARVIGSGTVDIAKEKINYVASVKFTSSTKINPTTTFEKMNTLPLDIRVNGSFDNPRIKLDFSKTLNTLVKKELKKQEKKIKDKVKKDLQKEIEKKLGDKLKNLLKF